MNEDIKKVKENIEKFLSEDMEHQNKHIDYILVDPESNETYVLASDENEEAIEFTPFTKDYKNGYQDVPEWDYNFDYYIYNYLEEGKQIAYMTDDVHYSIWNSIHELYPNDIDYKDGVQNYLQYCADNGITKEYLDKKTGFDTPDIMEHFEGLALSEKMEYKGYIIEADDLNYDNPKENIVNIYESQQDYIDGNSIERISLNTIGLKQNIKEYIDEVYINTNTVTLSQWQYERDSEKSYFTFVLGYDLLNDMLSKSATPENDVSYDFCNMIADKFLQSEEYKNEKHSAYEMLEQWVNENKSYIKSEYTKFTGTEIESKKTRELDNAIVLDVGYRGKEPIALVERKLKDYPNEYVVVFSYKVNDNKIDWAYGYYYDNDLKKAKQDFEKVISGGNLADTFNKNKKDKERSR